MESFGETIRRLREAGQLPLRTVAAFLDVDQAILSKIERGIKQASRDQVVKLAGYFSTTEDTLVVCWLSDKVVLELGNDEFAAEALKVAAEKLSIKQAGK